MRRVFFLVAAWGVTCFVATAKTISPPRFIVETRGNYLVGAWANGKWVPGAIARAMVWGGENYAVYSGLRSIGVYKGSKATSYGSPCADTYLVKLQMPPYKPRGILTRRLGPPTYVGVSGAYGKPAQKLMPRPVRALASSPAYHKFVVQWLKARGVKQPQVAISKIWRTDLEGDGTQEVIINAIRHDNKVGAPQIMIPDARVGDYSLLLVRRVKNKKVETVVLESQIYPQFKAMSSPTIQELTNVLDLNGDGALEVIVRGRYYQGDWMSVYEWRGGAPKRVLTASCGV